MRVMVTGSTGFIGRAVLATLALKTGCAVRGAARRETRDIPAGIELVIVNDLAPDTDWSYAVRGVDVSVHTAARVHVMSDQASDSLAEFRRVNVAGTLNLARQAAEAGVGRFVYISSIKVNGDRTPVGKPYTADDVPAPADAYGISKLEAEQVLWQTARETGMEVVIIRPTLVYGPGVKANFLSMMRYLSWGLPLPLGAVHNKRSMVALPNLVDLIVTCVDHPAATNQIFLAADGEDLSTTELLTRLGAALHKPARLLPVSTGILASGAALLGKQAIAERLLGSLRADISKTINRLNWTPPVSVDEALRETANHFLARYGRRSSRAWS